MPRLSEQRETIKSRHNADTIKNNLLKNKSSRRAPANFLSFFCDTRARCLLIKITQPEKRILLI